LTEAIEDLVRQYAEETAFMWSRRNLASQSPSYTLSDLAELDERLAAYIEGLHVSGISGWHHCEQGLLRQEPGEVFAAAVVALETCDEERLDKVFVSINDAPQAISGLTSAFGWVERSALKAIVHGLMHSQSPLRRGVGLEACALHRVDPGLTSMRALDDPSASVRARALRTAGELGQRDLLPACMAGLSDKDAECRFSAAWSAVLLGNRDDAVQNLFQSSAGAVHRQLQGFRLALQALGVTSGHKWLTSFAAERRNLRWLIWGSGIVGDPDYVPWLVRQMADPKVSRLAGEAFTVISGVDLGVEKLTGSRPDDFQSGPTDDPNDPNVDMDPDDGLPWPDTAKLEKWWAVNSTRFLKGTRYFMGAPVSREHCIGVLKTGYQRQRILAAHYLCLLEPGTPLFNTSAPAWRQQRWLAKM